MQGVRRVTERNRQNNVTIKVRVGSEYGDKIQITYMGIMQGDSLSLILFIFCLECALADNTAVPSQVFKPLTTIKAHEVTHYTT